MLYKAFASLAVLSAGVLAQGDLAALLSSQPDLSRLVDLAGINPDLITTLAGSTNITILAPTNAAFDALAADIPEGQAVASRNATSVLALLQNHVIRGYYPRSALNSSNDGNDDDDDIRFVQTFLEPSTTNDIQPFTNTTGGQYIGFLTDDDDQDDDGDDDDDDNDSRVVSGELQVANVVQADIRLGDGIIIHKIDRVNLFSPSVQQYASRSGLTVFNQAVQALGIDDGLGLASPESPSVLDTADITIFLPDNRAFENIGSIVNSASNEALTSILTYHVVPGNIVFSPQMGNGSLTTLNGAQLTITVDDDDIYVNNAKVLLPNGILYNGVAHIIDNVLNPDNTTAYVDNDDDDQDDDGDRGRVAFANATPTNSFPFATFSVSETSRYTTPSILSTAGVASATAASDNAGSSLTFDLPFLTFFGMLTAALLGALAIL